MARAFTIELPETRAAQVQHMAEDLGMAAEDVIKMALDLAMGDWKATVPGLESYEGPTA